MARQQVQGVGQQAIQGAAQISNVQGGTYNDDPAILRFAQEILGTGKAAAGAMHAMRQEEVTKTQEAMRSFAANNPEKMDQLVAAKTPEARQDLMKSWRESGEMPPTEDPAAARQLDAEIGVRLQGTVRDRMLEARANGEHLSRTDPDNPDKIIPGKTTTQIVEGIQQEYAEAYQNLGEDGKAFYGKSISNTVSRYSETFHQERLESELKIHQGVLSDALLSSTDTETRTELIGATVSTYGAKGEAMAIQATLDAAGALEATAGKEAAYEFLADVLETSPVNKDILGRNARWGSALGPLLSRLENGIDVEEERTYSKMNSAANVLSTQVLQKIKEDGMKAADMSLEELTEVVESAVDKLDTSQAGGSVAVVSAALALQNARNEVGLRMKDKKEKKASSELLATRLANLNYASNLDALKKHKEYYAKLGGLLPGLSNEDSVAFGKARNDRIDTLSQAEPYFLSANSGMEKLGVDAAKLPENKQKDGASIIARYAAFLDALPVDLPASEGYRLVNRELAEARGALIELERANEDEETAAVYEYLNTKNSNVLDGFSPDAAAKIREKAKSLERQDDNLTLTALSSTVVGNSLQESGIRLVRDFPGALEIDENTLNTIPTALKARAQEMYMERYPLISDRNHSMTERSQILSQIIKELKPEDLAGVSALISISEENAIRQSPGVPPYSNQTLAATDAGKEAQDYFKNYSDWTNAVTKGLELKLGAISFTSSLNTPPVREISEGSLRVFKQGLASLPRKQWLLGRHSAATAVLGGQVSDGVSHFPLVLSQGTAGSKQSSEILDYVKAAGVTKEDLRSIRNGKGLTIPYFYRKNPGATYWWQDRVLAEGSITIEAPGITLDKVPFIPDTLGIEKSYFFGIEETNNLMKNYEGELRAVLANSPELLGSSDLETVVTRQKTWLSTRISNLDI
jgi:hypothetical protein